MPELRLVVLALQDRLAYGPTFEAATGVALWRSGLVAERRPQLPRNPATERAAATAASHSPQQISTR